VAGVSEKFETVTAVNGSVPMNDAREQVPIAPGLFEWLDDGAHLIGSKCNACGEVRFPASSFCPQCCRETTENVPLSQRGRLHSFTVQRFKPPPPYKGREPFEPYGVGMIELPEGLRVTSVLEESDPAKLKVGLEMQLIITKFFEDEQGRDVVAYKFKPIGEGSISRE
jgi:uncharacterized OB-fold protein